MLPLAPQPTYTVRLVYTLLSATSLWSLLHDGRRVKTSLGCFSCAEWKTPARKVEMSVSAISHLFSTFLSVVIISWNYQNPPVAPLLQYTSHNLHFHFNTTGCRQDILKWYCMHFRPRVDCYQPNWKDVSMHSYAACTNMVLCTRSLTLNIC